MPVLWGACDPLTTPRPLGPFHDVAAQLGDDVSVGAQQRDPAARDLRRRVRAPPAAPVGPRRRRPALGRPGHDRPAALPAPPDPGHELAGGRRDARRRGRRHPPAALAPRRRRPLARRRDDDAPTAERRRRRRLDRGPSRSTPRWLHQLTGGNPFYVVEMLDHDGSEIPGTVRDAILARTSGLDADAWDVLHLLACAPEAIADHLLAHLGVGLAALRAVDEAGLIRRGAAGRRVPPRPVPHRDQRHPPARRCAARCTAACSTPSSRRDRRSGGADPPRARRRRRGAHAPPRHRRRPGRGPLRRPHAGGRVLRDGARAGRARVGRRRGRAPRAARRGVLPDRPARRRHRRQPAGDAAAAIEPTTPRGVSSNHHALSVYHWYNADRDLAEQPRCRGRRGARRRRRVALRRRSRPRSATRWRMQAYLALQANDIDAGATPPRHERPPLAAGSRRPTARGATPADRRHLRRAGGRAGQPGGDVGDPRTRRTSTSTRSTPAATATSRYLDVEQRRLRRRPSCSASPCRSRSSATCRSAGCGSSARVAG